MMLQCFINNKQSDDILATDTTNYEEVGSTRDSHVKNNPSYNVPAACFEVNQH